MRRMPLLLLTVLFVACTNTQAPLKQPIVEPIEESMQAMEEKKQLKEIKGADSAENAVNSFYNALSIGNGTLAVQFIIPEKQETGNYVSSRMSDYYGGLEQKLKVERIDWIGETQRRVVYSYKEQNKEKCKDIMDVNMTKLSDSWFIKSIIPRQICQTTSTPLEPVTVQSTNQTQSTVDMKIKCVQYGKQQYKDIFFDDGSIEFEFLYSPKLDTCLLQREEYGPGTAYAIMLYDMFTKNLLIDYREGIKCTATKYLRQNVICKSSLSEFNKAKTYLLQ